MSRTDELERRLEQVILGACAEFKDLGEELRPSLARALVHRAVHLAFDASADGALGPAKVEFCALATYLTEMVGHAHKLAHGDNPKAQKHKDALH